MLETLQLIHITSQEQYNVLVKALGLQGFKPGVTDAKIKGDRYVSNGDGFLAYPLSAAFVEKNKKRIIPFEQFIKEAI